MCLARASVPGVSCAVRYLGKPRWRAVGYSETPLLLSESVMSHPFPQNLLNNKDNARLVHTLLTTVLRITLYTDLCTVLYTLLYNRLYLGPQKIADMTSILLKANPPAPSQ